jgi:hypothetical protein
MTAPPTQLTDVLLSLRFLDENAQITISVRVGDLQKALEAKAGGPLVLTAEQAAQFVGRTPEYWRRAAKRGAIAGAWQDKGKGPWRLPREVCEAHLRQQQQRRAQPSHDVIPFDGGKARGPRRTSA